ncbi:MAG TPA: hypothetical protein VNH11_34020 [Pirellulales bacterium]|nr:hypothetical protein [Pirellulales bacterium]
MLASTFLILLGAVAFAEPRAGDEFGERVRDVLVREMWFMATVAELSPQETEALTLEAQRALDRWGARIESTSLGASLRRELTPLLKSISRQGWEKYDAERERLEERRAHATIVAQVAEYDEALLFTSEQRDKLCAELAEAARGIGWQTRVTGPPLIPARRFPPEISAGGLGRFEPAESRLAVVLTPGQLAAYKQFSHAIGQQIIVAAPGAQQAAAAVRPKFDDQHPRLKLLLERFVDAADAVCNLDDLQRQKLLIAGQIDIDQLRERYGAIESQEGDDPIRCVARLGALTDAARTMFDDPASKFPRTLRSRLTDEQKAKLAVAERERHAFRCQALVQAVVVGFERSAALTSAQCAELERTFDEAVADCPMSPQWQIPWLRTMTGLPHEKLRPILADQQWPAFERQLAQLKEVARRLEEEFEKKVGALRGVKIMAVDKDGKAVAELRADEIRLNLD